MSSTQEGERHPEEQSEDYSDESGSASDSDGGSEQQTGPACGTNAEWEEWEDEEGLSEGATKSLFDEERLPSPEAALQYDAEKHGFDLRKLVAQASVDEYTVFRLINYIRAEVAAGRDPRATVLAATAAGTLSSESHPWSSDDFLKPFLPDDSLLFFDFIEEDWGNEEDVGQRGEDAGAASSSGAAAPTGQQQQQQQNAQGSGEDAEVQRLRAQVRALQRQLEAAASEADGLRGALAELRASCLPEELLAATSATATATTSAGPSTTGAGPSAALAGAAGPSAPSTSSTSTSNEQSSTSAGSGAAAGGNADGQEASVAAAAAAVAKLKVDEAYFDSYSGFDIHREMLSDKPRTEAYQDALEGNPGLVSGATVMDVGCGTGILSLFACRAGAKRVISIDGSERIASFARRHSELAGYSSTLPGGGPMTVVAGKLEEIKELPEGTQQVDVIVSEWMGYALLFETMLDTVLTARDRWMKPGGAVLPDIASIYIAGASTTAGGLSFWRNVYGFDMSPVAEAIHGASLEKAVVAEVAQADLVTASAMVKELDLCSMKASDQDFTAEFTLEALPAPEPSSSTSSMVLEDGVPEGARQCGAFVLWFDTAFSERYCKQKPVVLTTSPAATTTHWAQVLLTLRKQVLLAPEGSSAAASGRTASKLTGRLSMVRSKAQHRSLDIALTYSAVLGDGSKVEEAQLYHMSVTAAS